MKNITKEILTAVTLLTVFSFAANAQTNVSGGIFANTTWTLANSPYIVTDNVVVFPGFVLTIEPGVEVKFDDTKYLEIRQATLIANGNAVDSITFTSNSSTPTPGIWGNSLHGIWLNSALPATSFNFCVIKYATIGISNVAGIRNSFFINNLSGLGNTYGAQIDSCIFKFNADGIQYANGCSINFCTFSNNTDGVASLNGGTMDNCLVDSNQTGLAGVYGTKINNCTINYNQTGIAPDVAGSPMIVKNCIIDYNSTMGIGTAGNNSSQVDSVINCEIKFNGIGLIAGNCSASSLVTHCVIENNAIGVQANHCSNISCNRICNNTTYNFKLTTSSNRSIANNYWCTNDSLTIANSIYDGYDNASLGLVNFMPIDTAGCYLVTGIPMYDARILSFSIYPNPATDKLTISGFTGKGEINIYNTMGAKVLQTEIANTKSEINIGNLSPGIYFVKVLAREKTVVRKVVKQ